MHKQSRSAVGDIASIAAFQLVVYVMGLVLIPALTRILPPESYGAWMQARTTIMLLVPVLSLSLGSAMVRFLSAEVDPRVRRRAVGTMLLPVLVLASVVLMAGVALARPLAVLVFADEEYRTLVPVLLAAVTTEAVSVLLVEYPRARNMIRFLSASQIGVAIVRTAALVAFAAAGVRLAGLLGALAAASLGSVVVLMSCVVRESGWPIVSTAGLGQFLSFSLPMIPVAVLLWVISSSDQYLITHIRGLSDAAVYSVSRTLGGLTGLCTMPIAFVVYPILCRAWEGQDTARVRSVLRMSVEAMLALAVPASVALCLQSRQLLTLVATSRYIAPGVIVLLVGMGAVFLGIFQLHMYVILLQTKPRVVAILVGAAAMCNVALNLVLIRPLGMVGAAVAALLSYMVLAGLGMLRVGPAWRCFAGPLFLTKLALATGTMGGVIVLTRGSGLTALAFSTLAGGGTFLLVFALLRPVPGTLRDWVRLFASFGHAPGERDAEVHDAREPEPGDRIEPGDD